MLALDENPPVMPSFMQTLRPATGRWWVGHTKSRFEKAFAWDLHDQNTGYFLPMVPRNTFSGGRKRKGMAALFPSYVFFCGDDNTCFDALKTNRLCAILPVPEQGVLVSELEQIHRLLVNGGTLEPYPMPPIGARCRVKSGPFEGVSGVVIETGTTSRLVLKVSVLGQGTSLEIDAELLEREEEGVMVATGVPAMAREVQLQEARAGRAG
jgi:transcription antitermination factor NusG